MSSYKVSFFESVHREANLPQSAVEELVINYLYNLRWQQNQRDAGDYLAIKDGAEWVACDENYPHGSIGTSFLRPATQLDKDTFAVVKAIRERQKLNPLSK